MKKAILATKVGMTQIFNEDGVLTPVTVLEAGPCVVTQVKTVENDGYDAIQVGFGEKKEKVVSKDVSGKKVIRNPHGATKAEVAHFKKAGTTPKRFVREFRFDNCADYALAQEIKADIFEAGDKVDATATSKGKGMPGQMGGTKVTIQNLEIVRVDVENNLLLVKGAVPGPKKSLVTIKESVKAGK